MESRDNSPESWWWETEEGRRWLVRLVVATLYTFGLKRGVGVETMSEFFARLRLETQVGCSPSALRGVVAALAVTIVETAGAWEQDGVAAGEMREMIGAVAETFLAQMMLVFQNEITQGVAGRILCTATLAPRQSASGCRFRMYIAPKILDPPSL